MDLKEILKEKMNLNDNLSPKEKYQIVEEFQEQVNKIFSEIKTDVYPNEPCKIAKVVRNHYLRHPIDCKPFDFLLLCYGTDLFFYKFPITNTTDKAYSWGLDVVISETDVRFSFSLRNDAKLLLLDQLEEMFKLNPDVENYIKINNYTHDVLFVNSYSKKIVYKNVEDVIPIIDGEFERFRHIYTL